MRIWLPLVLVVACNTTPADPSAVDPAEVKLRDTSIGELKQLLEKAKSDDPSDKSSARLGAPAICDRASLDRMKNKTLEQEILGECTRDLPEIEAFTELHRQPH
ncbi:MAG TPA: hypothetical protein VHB97_15255 [Polyangia bacterium]|nr:hypothetical protein [Polyangia bacterium]